MDKQNKLWIKIRLFVVQHITMTTNLLQLVGPRRFGDVTTRQSRVRTLNVLMQKHVGRFLLRPVREDQSVQSGLFGRRGLKRGNRGAAEMEKLDFCTQKHPFFY